MEKLNRKNYLGKSRGNNNINIFELFYFNYDTIVYNNSNLNDNSHFYKSKSGYKNIITCLIICLIYNIKFIKIRIIFII